MLDVVASATCTRPCASGSARRWPRGVAGRGRRAPARCCGAGWRFIDTPGVCVGLRTPVAARCCGSRSARPSPLLRGGLAFYRFLSRRSGVHGAPPANAAFLAPARRCSGANRWWVVVGDLEPAQRRPWSAAGQRGVLGAGATLFRCQPVVGRFSVPLVCLLAGLLLAATMGCRAAPRSAAAMRRDWSTFQCPLSVLAGGAAAGRHDGVSGGTEIRRSDAPRRPAPVTGLSRSTPIPTAAPLSQKVPLETPATVRHLLRDLRR